MKFQITLMLAGLLYSQFLHAAESVYTENKLGIPVSAEQPQFTLKLKSNPTTGFSWFLREYDPALLTPVRQEYQAPENKKLIGAQGYEIWTFKMKPSAFVVPQQTVLRLVYARAWEGAEQSTQIVYRISTQK